MNVFSSEVSKSNTVFLINFFFLTFSGVNKIWERGAVLFGGAAGKWEQTPFMKEKTKEENGNVFFFFVGE